jgi:hypothetical protein
MTRRQFRLLLIFNWLIVLVAIVVLFLTRPNLPPELRAYNEAFTQSSRHAFFLIFDGIISILFIVSYVGLYFFKKWARAVFVSTFIITLLEVPVISAYVQTGWFYMMGAVLNVTTGMLIAVMYFAPLKEAFERQADG